MRSGKPGWAEQGDQGKPVDGRESRWLMGNPHGGRRMVRIQLGESERGTQTQRRCRDKGAEGDRTFPDVRCTLAERDPARRA